MRRSFSFNREPALFLATTISSLLPGIEKVICVYYSDDTESLNGILLNNTAQGLESEIIQPEDGNFRISKLRKDNSPFSWLGKEDIPFELILKDKNQLNIFNEFNNNILLIKLSNAFDQQNDLFFIYFNQKIEKLGIVSVNKMISTENKTIIANLLRNSLLTMRETLRNDREIYFDLAENTRMILEEVKVVKSELMKAKEKSKDNVIRLSLSYLNEISGKDNLVYRLAESAVRKLKEYDGDPYSLRIILEKAADLVIDLEPKNTGSSVEINDYHIIFRDFKEMSAPASSGEMLAGIPEKYERTLQLLDRLENAAGKLKSRNKLLTSLNIGNEFTTPVTPPAITDALKKHGQKIVHLFNEYPDRWKIIRSEFRPVQNMINAIHEIKRKTA